MMSKAKDLTRTLNDLAETLEELAHKVLKDTRLIENQPDAIQQFQIELRSLINTATYILAQLERFRKNERQVQTILELYKQLDPEVAIKLLASLSASEEEPSDG